MIGRIRRIIVKKDDIYYLCRDETCGKCLWGRINPFGRKGIDDKCKVCSAKLSQTVYGNDYFDMESYSP